MIIRVKFGKEGALRFIGHLDVLRTFQKIFRRAGIAMVYSQGFSPHPIMSFALPLGLGLSSQGEYLDAEIEEGQADLLKRLQEASSDDLPVYSLRRLPEKAGNAMASVGRASYRLEVKEEWTDALEAAARALMSRDSILIQKETKSKSVEMDLRPCLYHVAPEKGPRPALIMELSAGSKANIKPELVWELLTRDTQIEGPLSIRRLDLMMEDGTSLGAVGEEIIHG